MQNTNQLPADFQKKLREAKNLSQKATKYLAAAAEKMKDANFNAQGFVQNGSASPRWKKRKKETKRSVGKKILFDTGRLKNSVKAKALSEHIQVGVDLGKVPYAKVHNEGGRVMQYVKPHTRKHYKSGKRYQVKAFARKIHMPKRKFLGYAPDVIKIAHKDIQYEIDKIFKN